MVIPDDFKTLTDDELWVLRSQLFEKIGEIEVEQLNRGFAKFDQGFFNGDDITLES